MNDPTEWNDFAGTAGAPEKEGLFRVLEGDAEVLGLAREAVEGGAAFRVWPGEVETVRLRSIYGRRRRTVERAGQPSLGFDEALEGLAACEEATVAIGYVDDRVRGGWYFQMFLTADRARLVACLAVKPLGGGRDEC